jgi:hypothetical protein
MPMFYFNVHDSDVLMSDDEGTDLPDVAAAREHATVVAKEIMFRRDQMMDRDWSRWKMSVHDDEGSELLEFTFSDVPA